jgi:hypothetical protein
LADIDQHDNVLDSEHADLDFDDASSKGNYVAADSAPTKRSHRKRSCADSDDSYSQIFEQLKDVK